MTASSLIMPNTKTFEKCYLCKEYYPKLIEVYWKPNEITKLCRKCLNEWTEYKEMQQ